MTTIWNPTAIPPDPRQSERPQERFDREANARRDDRGGDLRQHTGLNAGTQSSLSSRSGDFRHSLDLARRLQDDGRSSKEERKGEAEIRLLAFSLPPGMQPSPDMPALPARGEPAAPSARTQELVEQASKRIEQAVRAEIAPIGSGPATVKLRLDGFVDGMHGLTVVSSPNALDITLERATAVTSPELIAAAHMLAERLQTRFPNRAVRVLDRQSEDPAVAIIEAGIRSAISRNIRAGAEILKDMDDDS